MTEITQDLYVDPWKSLLENSDKIIRICELYQIF